MQGDITGQLAAYFARGTQTKAALARKAGMSEVYLHQVFSGRRKPSRDRLLCLCVGLGLNSRDLVHGKTLAEINDALMAEGERILF